MDYLDNLNDKQREAAVHTEGPLLILAGAGSGKTSTMTRRIAYLVREKGVSPYNILAVTFTNKAAGEMKERVEELIGLVSGMWITTFHSACLRMLRRYGELLGYEKGFNVYDPTDQKVIVKAIVKDMELDEKKFTPNYCLNVISGCKEKAKSPDTYRYEQQNNPIRRVKNTFWAPAVILPNIAQSKTGSDASANRNSRNAYRLTSLVCINPCTNKKQKMGNAIRPTSLIPKNKKQFP